MPKMTTRIVISVANEDRFYLIEYKGRKKSFEGTYSVPQDVAEIVIEILSDLWGGE